MAMTVFCRRIGPLLVKVFQHSLKRTCYKKAPVTKLKVRLMDDIVKIRNIGIIAHIDAGKTTTTERMLYYCGYSHVMGEVHDGDTVMDYMEQERERGITITSAAITFNWLKHQINLIDTPGHVDFTLEVERSLRVLDGAVVILDASAGVEAQTVTVWTQADRYNVPRIVYLNKMDKPKANVDHCIKSLKTKLKALPLFLHLPLFVDGGFQGVVDLLSMEIVRWPLHSLGNDGSEFSKEPLTNNNKLWELALKSRESLVESIADLDNEVAEKVISSEDVSNISREELMSAVRRITLQQLAVPVLCGSSYKNVGVQLLLDSVVSYLPSPQERYHSFIPLYQGQVCALAFKIVLDKIKGPLSFLRLYSGVLKEGQAIYNATQDKNVKVGKIMLAFADELREVQSVSQGQIAVVSGLEDVVTGDTLVFSKTTLDNAKNILSKESKENKALLAGIQVADPVFFCSIEAPSLSTQVALDKALVILQKEDPSLKVSVNPDSGQTIIAGMGELHIEIIRDRILKEYGVEAYLGPLQISYRESIVRSSKNHTVVDKMLGGVKHYVEVTLAAELAPGAGTSHDIKVVVTKENELGKLRPDHLKSIRNGMELAFANGPLLGCPVIDVRLSLLEFKTTNRTSPAMVSAAISQCVNGLLKASGIMLLEPVMKLEIVCEQRFRSKVLEDLQRRRSEIVNVEERNEVFVVSAKTPLSELRRYSSILRTFTSGTASFTMEFDSYITMDEFQQNKAIEEVTGFAPM